MAMIRQQEFIQSVADALQHISYRYPVESIARVERGAI